MMSPEAEGENRNELYFSENHSDSRPWWDVPSYLTGPIRFGTWDGVFVSIFINIFGVVLFLQGGLVVGTCGLYLALVLSILLIWMALSAGAAAVGICERTDVTSGGLYQLLNRVLGGKIGASIGLLFAFGLAVTAALYCTSFATAVLNAANITDRWKITGLSIATLIILLLINVAGVTWVIRFQIFLAIILAAAAIDFIIGPWVPDKDGSRQEQGFWGYNQSVLNDNLYPNFTLMNDAPSFVNVHTFFTVMGVYFPSICGVFAGVNMSGDLKNPAKNIPLGTISSIIATFFMYIIFMVIFASTTERQVLVENQMVGALISGSDWLFNIGIYFSSISGCASATYGAPRLIQSIAEDGAIRGFGFLEVGIGPNKVPLRAIIVVGIISFIFILAGDLKTISPIIAISFLLVYAVTEYANFVLSKAFHMKERKEALRTPHAQHFNGLPDTNHAGGGHDLTDTTRDFEIITAASLNVRDAEIAAGNGAAFQRNTSLENHIANSFGLGPNTRMEEGDLNDAFSAGTNVFIRNTDEVNENDDAPIVENDTLETTIIERCEMKKQPKSWYKFLCTPGHSLFACIVNIVFMFLINWIYALANIGIVLILIYYIHVTAPGVNPGLAANFSFFKWIKQKSKKIFSSGGNKDQFLIIPPPQFTSSGNVETVNSRGQDYQDREPFHQIAPVTTQNAVEEWNQSHPYGSVVYA